MFNLPFSVGGHSILGVSLREIEPEIDSLVLPILVLIVGGAF